MLELTYKILYRNGCRDVITSVVTEKDLEGFNEVNDILKQAFTDDKTANIRFIDHKGEFHIIRVQDVIRVSIKEKEVE